ncbi:selenoprotein M-like [Coccinella septempunctata]|uniref:selenoprotein M-like n=1 Tax=Coccinella septempunctata TaxID=41139 RepID=UPI001D06E7C7|nr:selenoprotein M-like [Coccinella septempunctata]
MLKILTIICFLLVGDTYAKIANARLESCPSCTLNRKPEVRAFAYEDLPKYGIEFKKIHGHLPELVFFDENDKEVERHSLSDLTRKECNDLLLSRGFALKNEDL